MLASDSPTFFSFGVQNFPLFCYKTRSRLLFIKHERKEGFTSNSSDTTLYQYNHFARKINIIGTPGGY
jgi:hypothetical protein